MQLVKNTNKVNLLNDINNNAWEQYIVYQLPCKEYGVYSTPTPLLIGIYNGKE